MKIITLCGTRPELIRLSIIIEKLDKLLGSNHVLIYTNQNYDPNLSEIFFKELNIRKPNYVFKNKSTNFSSFFAKSIVLLDKILYDEQPDKLLILGDTNTGLLSIIAQKHNIPIYHMEAGNRCFNVKVPEETNRRVIDHVATYNLPYTENAKNNLLVEGFHKNKVFKTGNPIFEVLNKHENSINKSTIQKKLDIENTSYILVTCHRAENVDDNMFFEEIVSALNYISTQYKIIFSVHPRTRKKIENGYLKSIINKKIKLCEPFGLFDFVNLEKSAKLVLTDSGTVQEECAIFQVPCIVMRESTERQELIECGSSTLSGIFCSDIIDAFELLCKHYEVYDIPSDYLVDNVSDIVINILKGK